MAAAPSPLAQAHRPPRSDAGSDSESDSDEQPKPQTESVNPTVQSVQERLAQLALIKEVDIDTSKLDALTPEVIANQATINIGQFRCTCLGPVRETRAPARDSRQPATRTPQLVVAPPTYSRGRRSRGKAWGVAHDDMAK